jgi:cysteine protease ATG4
MNQFSYPLPMAHPVYPFDPGMSIMSSGTAEISDFPQTDDPVYILGKRYSALHELEELRDDFRSLIWMTYRSGFPPIGGSGPTSDRGWGCMLRCGQMVFANALARKHLGREWRWIPPTPSSPFCLMDSEDGQEQANAASLPERDLPSSYKQLLRLFSDDKLSPYSIHQISQMGESEGKPVGTWFGPNTVAQALKKLSVYEKVNNLNIQVAMDNLVIVNEISKFIFLGISCVV